jgi:hypothetical protein
VHTAASPHGTPTPPAKPAWPLFVLAVTGFIPLVGFFTGMAAVIWGLLADRPKALWAAGLGALAVVTQLGLSLVFLSWLGEKPGVREAQADVIRTDLISVVVALEKWHEGRGAYPDRLQALIGTPLPLNMVNIYDHSAGIFRVPRTYQYEVAPDGRSYDLYAMGPDGEPGTEDDIRPALPDSLQARSGYRP